MTRSPAPPIEIEAIRSLVRFREIRTEWTRALEGYGPQTLFASFPWIEAWWTAFDADDAAVCLVAREGERLVGMAPLMIESRRVGPWRVPVLRFLGNHLSPRSDLVLIDRVDDVLSGFVACLRELNWTYFDCGRVPADSPGLQALGMHVGEAFSSIRPRRAYRVPCVELVGTWDEYLQDRSKHFRRGRRREDAKVQGLEVRRFPGEIDDPDAALEAIRSVSEDTWAHRQRSSLVSDRRSWALFERLLRGVGRSGSGGASFLFDGDLPVAFLIWMKQGRTVYYLKHGYRTSFSDRVPGANLLAATLRREFQEHPGFTVDLDCAVSDSDYKLRWASVERSAVASYVFRSRLSSRILGGFFALKRRLRIPFRVSSR